MSINSERREKVFLYDTTLRDGAQREGISFTLSDKLKITQELDKFGVDFIEGGWPHSNPKDFEYFKKVKKLKLNQAKIVVFGSTRRKGVKAEDDENLKSLLDAQTEFVCIFGKSWDVHVTSVLVTTLEENLRMITDSVSFLKKHGRKVIFDAEHFFDGYKKNPDYALKSIMSAQEAGAEWIVLADTNGGTLPEELKKIISEVKPHLKVPFGIHAHNDNDCAVANSLIAVELGARQVQGTINGYGERCGNANLCSIIPALELKMGYRCLPDNNLSLLTEVSHFVAEVSNIPPDFHQPYVGQSAFAHKGGVHISAVLRHKKAYEHIEPEQVGNISRLLVSELSGVKSLVEKAKETTGIDLSDQTEKAKIILKKLKEKEKQGYLYEIADGSFGLFVLRNLGRYRPLFELESYEVTINRWRSGRFQAEAIVKLIVNQERKVEIGEGNGPVNALDRALRKALEPLFPNLTKIFLSDYRVRVFGQEKGTQAKTRVFMEFNCGQKSWGTVGVSENIIEASWQALVEGYEYGLQLT